MNKTRKLFCLLCALMALTASAQCRYCLSYNDFVGNRWETVDSIDVVRASKGHKFLWGGGDFTIKGTDKASCKMLTSSAFAVIANNKLYVNCKDLKYKKIIFGKGFSRAFSLGNRGLIFVGIDSKVAAAAARMGAVGGGVAATQEDGKVCYLISHDSGGKRYIEVSPVDDVFMAKLLAEQPELLEKYYSETNPSERIHPNRIFSILKISGYVEDLK